MVSHRRERVSVFKVLTRRQRTRLIAGAAALILAGTAGIVSRGFYSEPEAQAKTQVTSYSATQMQGLEVSRDSVRKAINEGQGGSSTGTAYVKVIINGKSKLILGDNFTTVKSVLDAGDITLEPDDTVAPGLNTKVTESTVIQISRSNSEIQSSESEIPFNTIEEKTDSLPAGTTKVKTEGKAGVMETTSLITKVGGKNSSSNIFASYVKNAPVNKVILIGTGKVQATTSSSSAATTTAVSVSSTSTTPVGTAQSIAHSQVVARGWSESDFTCLVQLWNRESGWSTTAANPSGAYGIPQALRGSKMASAGSDWATNAATQITWGLGYIAGRYTSPCGAWSHSESTGWY
ncbi:G5 domain-containing protein [Bifidobacterium aquikefiri]|uniref:aggregation-promoting factor C-terminal-like domain-containing protein n=1 Tax=Bifidobacterium aquikefiri TaxID=1653207 RepID=UPI0039E73BBA